MMASVATMPPPVGGLNARDAISDMPEQDAIILTNWVCEPDYLRIRRGHQSYANSVSGGVTSLLSWEGPTSAKLFAMSADSIYDATAGGDVGTADVSGLTGGDWLGVMFANSGGNYLWMANGADAPYHYNGSVWQQPSLTGIADASDLVAPFVHKRRIWAIEDRTMSAWYLEADAIAGAMTEFDFGPIFTEGGYLLAAGSITRDGGSGPDDFACFVTSNGQAAVYAGTDPASASTWALVGVFTMPPPIGRRCLRNVGGDLVVITEGGILSFNKMMQLERNQSDLASVTSKINRRFNVDALSKRSEAGWQIVDKPRSNLFIVNVPTGTTDGGVYFVDENGEAIVDEDGNAIGETASVATFNQYAMNALTGSWSDWRGLNGKVWTLHEQELYFGDSNGFVWKADTGYQDNGDIITADLKTAFSGFGKRGRLKAFEMIKPYLDSDGGSPGILLDINTDYQDVEPTSTPTAAATTSALWGSAVWGVAVWPQVQPQIDNDWQGVAGLGETGAVRMRVTSNGSNVKLYGFDVMIETGGMI